MNPVASGLPVSQVPPDVLPAPILRRRRLLWLDFLRGAAVLVMMETHVVNTFLLTAGRASGWFATLNYLNGLVAPSFLFIAGYVQGMERRRAPRQPIRYSRRAFRLLGIAALGYAMHFPVGQITRQDWSEALRVGFQVDVLQCLALGLGLVLGVGWLIEKARWPAWSWVVIVVALATAAVIYAPAVQTWSGNPLALRAWVNNSTGSLFPIFPWVGFVFLGALAGSWPDRFAVGRLAGIGALAVLAGVSRGEVFSAFSPAFFLERAAWVLALAAVGAWIPQRAFPQVVLYPGQHSLKFYVGHLALITTLVGAGIPSASMGWPGTLALLAVVGGISFAFARLLDLLPRFFWGAPSETETRMVTATELPDPAA